MAVEVVVVLISVRAHDGDIQPILVVAGVVAVVELELLTDVAVATIGDAHRAVEALRDAGPKVVLVTSLVTEETPAAEMMFPDTQPMPYAR